MEFKGYHTCKKTGGRQKVLNDAPFYSECDPKDGTQQWLGSGYYFWTDSPTYARDWGQRKRFAYTGYYIVEANIKIENDRLLDLVGNVGHQEKFIELCDKVRKVYKQAVEKHLDLPELDFSKESVSDYINSFRFFDKMCKESGITSSFFDYVAVKAQDLKHKSKIKFTRDGNEVLALVSRQQVCIFEGSEKYVFDKEIHYES